MASVESIVIDIEKEVDQDKYHLILYQKKASNWFRVCVCSEQVYGGDDARIFNTLS